MHISSKCQYSSCPADGRGGDRPSRRHFYPGSTMTDGQWALLAPLLPAAGSTGGRGGRPEKWDRRLVLDAIFYLVRGGIAWRALPADFPPHQTVYALFRRWTRARACCRNAALRESHDLDRRHLAAQQPPHPLTQFTDALSDTPTPPGGPPLIQPPRRLQPHGPRHLVAGYRRTVGRSNHLTFCRQACAEANAKPAPHMQANSHTRFPSSTI